TVLIESPQHTHGITVTKDGVTVAKSINLLDPVENLAVQMMREAADKTASSAGDGTTTAIVLTEALVKHGIDKITADDNKTEVLREIVKETEEVIKRLQDKSTPVSDKMLKDVAVISSNNDQEVGTIIADTYKAVGTNGIVTVEKSQNSDTTFETTKGIKIDRGYSSHLFVNNHKKDECILEDVHVLVSDSEINNILSIEQVLKPIIADNKKLLIVAPCSQNVINTLAANVMKNNLKLCTIIPPNFGYKQHELMNDIALSVGATYFSEQTGDDLSLMTFQDLGRASKVIADKDNTIILKDKDHVDDKAIKERVDQLWDAHKITEKKVDKEFIMSRIASLTGGVGVIRVGGNTDLEQKELFDRVDDAVCAVRSALEQGILPGGGLALYDQGVYLTSAQTKKGHVEKSKLIANAILGDALLCPMLQIHTNAGLQLTDDSGKSISYFGNMDRGIDVKNKKMGNMIKMGVIDPMKVTKVALQNAVSVAVTILSTNAIITMARTYESK
ncbi:chaperonin GroEL, partial [Flavobacteriaceae bacterium]|nr:chaperonin GroEL [Flavobacteriaceae bacterium]